MNKIFEFFRRNRLLFHLRINLLSLFFCNSRRRKQYKQECKKRFYLITERLPSGRPRGRVLLYYMAYPQKRRTLNRHAVIWSSCEIARLFQHKGFAVDVVSNERDDFIPNRRYDIIFDNYWSLPRFAPTQPQAVKAVLFSEGYQPFANQAENSRIADLRRRRPDTNYQPKRSRPVDCMDKSYALVDLSALIGNHDTLATFPAQWQSAMTLVTTNVLRPAIIKNAARIKSSGRAFLWHFGHGAVHKGLDLLLEVFSRHPQWQLHVTGNLDCEPDFMAAYHQELFNCSNINYHGFIDTQSRAFKSLLQECFCFIAPSCSEGISPACAMLLQAGLYPVLSRRCGITLPPNCGIYLNNCSPLEIEQAIEQVVSLDSTVLAAQISACQQMALRQYSRQQFTHDMSLFIDKIIARLN